jgi:class 3 adenylate cyclase
MLNLVVNRVATGIERANECVVQIIGFCFLNAADFNQPSNEQYRQCTYSTIEDRSCSCCSENEIRIAYSECVFVALSIQHAMRILHVVICGLSGFTVFSYIIK